MFKKIKKNEGLERCLSAKEHLLCKKEALLWEAGTHVNGWV